MKDLSLLNKIIVGRVEPHIYAFNTNSIPNYLKVGDTYRPVSVRLEEWKKHFPDLEKKYDSKALVSDDIFFRDYSVHQYLENNLNKKRLNPNEIEEDLYYSNEFFKDTDAIDIEDAIKNIQQDFDEHLMKYQYYNAKDNLRIITEYASTGMWDIRPNQQEVIDNFKKAYESGRTNLLLYAVMRFGKSFTSMCCAKEMDAKIVLIVSAKADVKEEWKKTIQSADNFAEFCFVETSELLRNNNIIKQKLDSNKKVVMFLTLQDLQGNEIKEKHKEIFLNNIDLLLIDETHFGARAPSYGAVLRDVRDTREDEIVEYSQAEKQIKKLKSKVRIHLSGTPYRILMGSEFEKEDIIGFCQFSDIVKAQEDWDKEHLLDDNYKEWDNPYYGFPQMIRFAFNPNELIRKKIEELRNKGVSFAFSELFRPLSITKNSNNEHKKFKYENEILDLFEVIDGSKDDEEVLGFLDYNKIKEGNMCRHIVIVLPFCASCDALEELILSNSTKFKNLSEYKIINISGVDKTNIYRNVTDVKEKIKSEEKNNNKTITLTVNRMLTGSTVEEWDTMIYLKDTTSPQEYDQAIFRLQNQYIKEYVSENGDVIKYNKKPQTLLVDFDPNRMFVMQENKSLIYNVNVEKSGNSKLEERLENELKISPIIVLNKNKIKEITAADIMKYISNYSNNRSIIDESNEIPIDLKLLQIEDIKKVIMMQPQLGSSGGLKIYNSDEEGNDDLNIEEIHLKLEDKTTSSSNEKDTSTKQINENHEEIKKAVLNKFKTYYVRILFYSFLTNDDVKSLENIINTINNDENKRIAKNLGLEKNILLSIYQNIDPFILSQLDYKIQNINNLTIDDTLTNLERVMVAINKFSKISESEIITPQSTCDSMLNLITDEELKNIILNKGKILDIASSSAEFVIAFYRRLEKIGVNNYENLLYSIPTSSVAYEFIRKIYKLLNLNISNIAEKFTTYDMLKSKKPNGTIDYEKNADFILQNKEFNSIELKDNIFNERSENGMKFDIVVGNPPYQSESETKSSNGQKPRTNIFHYFQIQALHLAKNMTILIYPGVRWIHQSGKGLKDFGKELINNNKLEKLIFYPNSKELFENIDIPDGISIVKMRIDKEESGFEYCYKEEKNEITIEIDNPGDKLMIINPKDSKIAKKINQFVEDNNIKYLSDSIMPRSLFDIDSDFVEKNGDKVDLYNPSKSFDEKNKVKLFTNDKSGPAGRTKWFLVDKELINKNSSYIYEWQVVVSSAHPGGQEGRDNQIAIIDNHSAFGRARIALKSFKTQEEANNFYDYANSKIIKYCFLLTDESLTSLGKAVPDIIDYSKDNKFIDFNHEIDEQLRKLINLTDDEFNYIKNKVD